MRERGERVWLAKSIGDGYMLCYPVVEVTIDSYSWETAGRLRLRGFNEPIEAFRLRDLDHNRE
jgi:class 3 adenylate cyclase